MSVSVFVELEIVVSGTVTPGYAATRDDPGAEAEVVDLEIADVLLAGKSIMRCYAGAKIDPPQTRLWDRLGEIVSADAIEAILTDHDPAGDAADAAYDRLRDEVWS